ncbi:MAG TPA: hypothetical protein VLZ10_10885 [Thermodesulfobacteriota bacterium]|nr:hypothetical protein [Thermodesulfobacteriota bacterium]
MVVDTKGQVSEEASSRRIRRYVTGMSLAMGVGEDPREIAVASSIGPTASEFGCPSLKGGEWVAGEIRKKLWKANGVAGRS